MYNHNKAQQSKNRVHISWDILYTYPCTNFNSSLTKLSMEDRASMSNYIPLFYILHQRNHLSMAYSQTGLTNLY